MTANAALSLGTALRRHFVRVNLDWQTLRTDENIITTETINGVQTITIHGSTPTFGRKGLDLGGEYEFVAPHTDLRAGVGYSQLNRESTLMYPYVKGQKLHFTKIYASSRRSCAIRLQELIISAGVSVDRYFSSLFSSRRASPSRTSRRRRSAPRYLISGAGGSQRCGLGLIPQERPQLGIGPPVEVQTGGLLPVALFIVQDDVVGLYRLGCDVPEVLGIVHHVHVLDWALHLDESTPHIHERHVFDCENKYGEVAPQQEKALEALGFDLPDPEKPLSRRNNRKITFDAACRKMLFEIAKRHGLELEENQC